MTMDKPTRTPLDPAALRERLAEAGYRHVEVVEQTVSTNTDIADRVRLSDELPDMSVLLAEEQTAGRGRKGRAFFAPAHSQVICSVLIRVTEVPVERISLLPLLTGLSIAEAVRSSSGLAATVKWPNDVTYEGRKLSGILVEAAHLQPHAALILGFGVNYDLQPGEIPVEHASSIAALCDTVPSREDFTVEILTTLAENLARWRNLGGAPQTILPRYRELSSTLNTQVRAHLPGDKTLVGRAVAIDDDGELIIRTEDGQRHTVRAGEIVHLRPDGTGDYGGAY